MDFLSAVTKKSGHCKEVALAKVRLYLDILKSSCLNKFYSNVRQAIFFLQSSTSSAILKPHST